MRRRASAPAEQPFSVFRAGGYVMIRMLTAHTAEVDDADFAVAELLEQLDCDRRLLKNSVGVITCYADFLEGDVIPALCERLPFDVVGITTLGTGTEKASDLLLLTVSVLTSDEVSFSAALTESLAGDHERKIQAAYDGAAAALPGGPALVLAYVPMMERLGGEKIASRIDAAAVGVPVFGTVACDQTPDSRLAHTIFNGAFHRDRLALILMSGPVKARFFLGSLPLNNVQKHQAVITASEGNILHEINGMPAAEYLRGMGLAPGDILESAKSLPIVVDYRDGTPPVIRGFYSFTDKGSAICGGEMPVNATFALSALDGTDVLRSTGELFDDLLQSDAVSGALLVSCLIRSYALEADPLAETALVAGRVAGGFPYQICYAGGELGPVYGQEGGLSNRYHNFSFIGCVFEE